MNQLTKIEPMPVAANETVLTPTTLLQSIVKGGITADNVNTFEKALEIAYRMEQREAEKQFTAAFVALQADLPVIVAKSIIPNRGKYEKFEDVMEVVAPLLSKHGFTVSFSMDFKDNRILETCHLKHIGGHSQSNSFAVRTGKADSETQADCKAATTAKRNALLNALNIVVRQDVLNSEHDAGIEGDPKAKVTQAQAEELERRAKETNSNIAKFLQLAGADKFSEIPSHNYDMLDRMLSQKERAGK